MLPTHPLTIVNRRRLLAACALAAGCPGALAQTIVRPAHIVVGFSPGGGADGVARLLADKLRGAYAPTVVVENRVGAGARIAIDYARQATADGTTMVFVPDATMFLYPYV